MNTSSDRLRRRFRAQRVLHQVKRYAELRCLHFPLLNKKGLKLGQGPSVTGKGVRLGPSGSDVFRDISMAPRPNWS